MGWQYDRILLDPPRSGALEMVQTIGRFDAARIVVVRIRTGESGSAAL
jgi:tRNA/tmRNA/rRNA uracil-C5-methylase (TrmA/RlmC/RlmD family)